MLQSDPKNRPTAQEVLNDYWFDLGMDIKPNTNKDNEADSKDLEVQKIKLINYSIVQFKR